MTRRSTMMQISLERLQYYTVEVTLLDSMEA
jgi:hypothetical protein